MGIKYVSYTLTTMLFSIGVFLSPAQNLFEMPIQGQYGKEYIIVNYVDWGVGSSFKDLYCLDKTYDGHEGTDFTIQDFESMDKGIDVLAVDSGRVIFVKDGIFDREKHADTSKGLGNYLAIEHKGKLQSYYGHLKKSSILVSEGDKVKAGQKIAEVGSSGNSASPHLHFELWYDSLYYIDPFSGPCGNRTTYWKNQVNYDSTFQVWEEGMLDFVPSLDSLKEGLARVDTFYRSDSTICTWSLMYGLRHQDSLVCKWYTPSGNLWFQYSNHLNQNWWYYYYWTYLSTSPITEQGKWHVAIERNGHEISSQSFYFYDKKEVETPGDTSLSILTVPHHSIMVETHASKWVIKGLDFQPNLVLIDTRGQKIAAYKVKNREVQIDRVQLSHGLYILQNQNTRIKLFNKRQVR